MKALDLVERDSALLVLTVAAASWTLGLGRGWSVILGGGFMLANFRVIRILVGRVVGSSRRGAGSESGSSPRTWPLFVGKLLLGIALMAGVLYQFRVEPLSFAAGATMLLVVITVRGLTGGLANDPDDPGPPGNGPAGVPEN